MSEPCGHVSSFYFGCIRCLLDNYDAVRAERDRLRALLARLAEAARPVADCLALVGIYGALAVADKNATVLVGLDKIQDLAEALKDMEEAPK